MAISTLAELEAALKAEAAGAARQVRLGPTFLAKRVTELIARYLPPLTGTVVLGAAGGTIVLRNDPAGVPTLWLQNFTVPAGPANVPLNLPSHRADVAIQLGAGGEFDLVLRLTLPADWVFGDSLPALGGVQPPDYLATPQGQFLYFSSFEGSRPRPAFPGEPAPSAAKVVLTGLTYYAPLELAGIFAQAVELIGLGKIQVPLSGPVTPDPVKPEVELRAHPEGDPLTIGFIELGVPFIGVKVEWADPKTEPEPPAGEDALAEPTMPAPALPAAEVAAERTPGGSVVVAEPVEEELYPVFLYFVGADIEIDPHEGKEGVGIELRAIFNDPGASDFLLVLGPVPGQKLNLGSLATKLLGTTEGAMEKEAASLKSYLDVIALESFSASISPTSKTPIQYIRAQIGTEPPWKIGPGGEYELDLTFTWTTYFFTPETMWSAEFEALLTLSKDLSFDVTVTLPQLAIAGSEHGTVELSLSDLNSIFPMTIPEGLLDLTLTNFYVGLATNAAGDISSFTVTGTAGLSIAPFGTPLLALENVDIAVAIDYSQPTSQYTLNVDGEIILGGALRLAGSATASNVPHTKTVFTLHLVDETVGSMLNHLVHLVDPTFNLTMPAPWDRFLAISLDAFVLEVNLTDETVSLAYEARIDLEFLVLTKLGLTYARKPKAEKGGAQPPKVTVDVEGSFLGRSFGVGKESPPLSWDPVNEAPPSVPGKSTLLDLRYAGLGQHIGFYGEQPTRIPEVLEDLRASVLPIQGGQLPQFGTEKGQLSFQAGSGWLIGADLTVMGTVSLGAIFNDPSLYGIRIGLEGEKAKAFAGLQFEILYRKVTDTIGVYHIELTLPTAMRTLEFGEVSLTLPVLVLDIYTNGNFRIDLGFPKGLDFSSSFCLQVFPFIGYGGFYFALLDGATSTRVPQITNGEFHPVIEFGVGLQVGVGKTIDEGILSGGLSVTVIGIVEGVLAWFHPTEPAPEEVYFQLHGTIAVIGRLYAKIDFAIIQASLDVTAILSVTLAVESHQPILIEASASVSVRVSVKIVFFTIHLSFSATISASFTIGSATPTPWKLKEAGSGTAALAARAGRPRVAATPEAVLALPTGHRRAIRRALVAGTVTPIENWPAVAVFPAGKIQEATLWALLSFTRAEGSGLPRAVMLLAAENAIAEGVQTAAELRAPEGEPQKKAFNVLVEAMLRWGVHVETHPAIAAGGAVRKAGTTTVTTERPHGFLAGTAVILEGVADASFDGAATVAEVLSSTSFTVAQAGADATSGGGTAASTAVSADQLEDLRQSLGLAATTAAAFDPATLEAFLGANLALTVEPAPAAGESKTGVAMFPISPALTLKDTAGVEVDFGTTNEVTLPYQENVRDYFASLQVQFEKAREAGGEGGAAALAASPEKAPLSAVLFSQYFNMLMSQGVKAAIELLAAFPFTTGAAAMSIAEVGAALDDPDLADEPLRIVTPNQAAKEVLQPGAALELPEVTHQVRSGDSLASIAQGLVTLGARDLAGAEYTAAKLLEENNGAEAENEGPEAGAIFSTGTPVTYSGITYTTQPHDTLELIAARLLVRIGGARLVNGLLSLSTAVEALLKLNPKIGGATEPIPAGEPVVTPGNTAYTAVAGDTLTLVAAYAVAVATVAISPAALVAKLLAENQLTETNPTKEQPVGTVLKIPPLERAMAAGDRVESIARTLIAPRPAIEASLLAVPATSQLLSPHAVLKTPMRYLVKGTDTLAGIATALGISLVDLAEAAASAAGLFAPGKEVTVEDVPSADIERLLAVLAEREWNTVAGMVSRFLLAGLRLPDPADPTFEHLTPEELRDPKVLAKVPTKPLYELTGQQFPIAEAPPANYAITLSKVATAAGWLKLGAAPGTAVTYSLSEKERTLLGEVAKTSPTPEIQTAGRLALLRMLPTRTALRRQIAWQAAAPPAFVGGVTNPSVWMFTEQLIETIASGSGGSSPLYELAVMPNALPEKTTELGFYRWATLVDLTISLPQVSGAAPAAANAYVIDGADDTGAKLLQQLQQAAEAGTKMSLFLLYQPDPAGSRPSGLASDALDPKRTWVLKTNLTTLTSSGGEGLLSAVEADPTGAYASSIEDPAEFLALLWEASITRSGGFYLEYANADGGAGLPGTVFGSGRAARLSLLAIPEPVAAAPGPLERFHNCGVVAESIDPASSTVVAQPVTHEVVEGESLTSVQTAFAKHRPGITVLEVARTNAAVPQLLRLGAPLTVPGQGAPYIIGYGDTLDSIVAANPGLTLEALVAAGANATAPILAAGAQLQLSPGVLSPSATAPPGTVGFELVRPNPDPKNLPYEELSAAQLIDSLFNLTAWNLAPGGGFLASGQGLPTVPTESGEDWSYAQALGAAAFAASATGSASAALPAAAENPYNGVEVGGGRGEATLALAAQDVYGNRQALPPKFGSVPVPVGYYDEVVGLAAWPSLALAYLVEEPNTIALSMTMQQDRYVPSASVSVDSALASAQADLASYRVIYYQLAQPDLHFTLRTTLALDAEGKQRVYKLPKAPFLAFARGAYVQLAALSTLAAVELAAGGQTVAAAREEFGVTASQLLVNNQDRLYSALFGETLLKVPAIYVTVEADTLSAVAKRISERTGKAVSVAELATMNEGVALNPGAALATPARKAKVEAGQSLAQAAAAASASVVGLAEANAKRTDILAAKVKLAVGTTTYETGEGDSLEHAATKLKTTVAQVAAANQFLTGLLLAAELDVTDAVVVKGETLAALAARYDAAGGAKGLAEANEKLENLFAPATSVQVGWSGSPQAPHPSESLARFAQANEVTVDQLASANEGATFAAGATVEIPATLEQTKAPRWSSYAARGTDTLAGIAALFGLEAAALAALDPDLPGLLAPHQTVKDSRSGTAVTTAAEDTFETIQARFLAEHSVTVSLAELAADVAEQAGLLEPGGLWICPPMRGDAHGKNAEGTLSGLALAYGTEVKLLATTNAATRGLLAGGVTLALPGWPPSPHQIVTRDGETFNSLVNRLAQAGVTKTVEEVAEDTAKVPKLVVPEASVVPIPPPSPADEVAIEPGFDDATFQLVVQVSAEREAKFIDPEFTGNAAVLAATTTIAPLPEPGEDAGGTLALTAFAERLQKALPGLAVATGAPAVEDEPNASSTVWCVNFGNEHGPQLGYELAKDAAYFALPPLSSALMGGTVTVKPYTSGSGLGKEEDRSFQAIDLDAWLGSFFEAVDVFLSPASAVPAYAASPADVEAVVKAKQELADAISQRVTNVLEETGGTRPAPSVTDAQERMRQAMLQRLGNATTVSTLVQLPATVTHSTSSDPLVAPRLSGRLVPAEGEASVEEAPDSYSFSTAKLPLTTPQSTATFLFSVKAPAASSRVGVDVSYAVTEIELPDPGSRIGDYEGSSWLKLVDPFTPTPATKLTIPVPLRAYPSPVTLVSQVARQSVEKPTDAAKLRGWDFDFVYQHDDAGQDTPVVEVAFDPAGETVGGPAWSGELDLQAVFAALAEFVNVEQPLANDLAKLAGLAPGTTNPVTTTAVKTFAEIVTAVAGAFTREMALAGPYKPSPMTFYYRFVREQTETAPAKLDKLVVTAINPETGEPRRNPLPLWPSVWVVAGGGEPQLLTRVGEPTATEAVYQYPAGTAADPAPEERFGFAFTGEPVQPPKAVASGAQLAGPKSFGFGGANAILHQSGRAGVSIWRNSSLIPDVRTNPVFVYKTPTTRFPAVATPAILATNPIPLSNGKGVPLAQALGEFLKALTEREGWKGDETLTLRLGCGYRYAVASSGGDLLASVVPNFLVPSSEFHPAAGSGEETHPADWDWASSKSFVSQVAKLATEWRDANHPAAAGGAFVFDLTVYASSGLQPLIHASSLQYDLS